jgi:hypothetical protein
MHRLLFRSVNIATVVYIVGSVEAFSFIDRQVYGSWAGKGGDKLTAAFSLLQIITSLYLFIRAYRQTRRVSTGAMLALILVGYIMMTAAWSIDPGTTVRRAILYMSVVVGAIGIAGAVVPDLRGVRCSVGASLHRQPLSCDDAGRVRRVSRHIRT